LLSRRLVAILVRISSSCSLVFVTWEANNSEVALMPGRWWRALILTAEAGDAEVAHHRRGRYQYSWLQRFDGLAVGA